MKRVFLVVLDSVGIGELPDASAYGDVGSHTLYAASTSRYFNMPNMRRLGLFHIDGVKEKFPGIEENTFAGAVARLAESSKGKDTTTGHWEIAGIISEKPFPTYPNGFPEEIIREFEQKTGRKVICNKPYSGTEVIKDYGEEHVKTGALIVYTSADSVFQIAAHEEVVPLKELYHYCEIAREILRGEHSVGRVIARPFIGTYPNYQRTPNRHDYSMMPATTMLDQIKES
ncbi:MAG TPA: phosphopentomutase, partial [Lachnospiraceae bacterium]|nr:phosphopentomutase [Lachnospiraceae bacterium]